MNLKKFSFGEYLGAAVAVGVLILGACAPKQVKTAAAPAAPPVAVSTVPPVQVAEANVRTGAFVSVPEVKTVYFNFNQADLTAATRKALQANAAYLKDHQDLDARVAGYCDERGTVEYNLALGQRRAKAVRDYYIRLGVDGSRIATISYGKENPVCAEHNEACWSKNRRAETGVRSNTAASSAAQANPVAPGTSPAATPAAAPAPTGQ